MAMPKIGKNKIQLAGNVESAFHSYLQGKGGHSKSLGINLFKSHVVYTFFFTFAQASVISLEIFFSDSFATPLFVEFGQSREWPRL